MTSDLTSNIADTALVFEGGGMRASYTAAVVVTLLKEGIYFNHVSGISAGASHTGNYLSRDVWRARDCFTDFAGNPDFGSWKTWLRGQGRFNARYIYEESWLPDGDLPFDATTFMANPARFRIGAFDCDSGETKYWSHDDVHLTIDIMRYVRASSSLPMVMPPVTINRHRYLDGGLGTNAGIPLEAAQMDGYQKFFVVLTRPRDYVKPPQKGEKALRLYYRRHPAVAQAIIDRPQNYARVREELFELERQGKAYLFVPERMTVENSTHDVAELQAAYEMGLDQARRELPRWREFLGV